MILNTLEKQTIISALRNGLGLTHACRGLHKHPKEVSEFIKTTPAFELECNQSCIAGYQMILIGMNDASNKKAWEKWRTANVYINQFITSLNLWESMGTKDNWDFQTICLALKNCKTIAETATSFGFTETEFHAKLYTDTKLIHWLIQNGYQI